MHGNSNKLQMNARVTQGAYDGFAAHCEAQGISLTAFLEALGTWLAEFPDAAGANPGLNRLSDSARAIDAERRFSRRTNNDKPASEP
jgi:hypothetical protein